MRSSICWLSIPRCKATDSMSSIAWVGRKWMVLPALGRCPLRPARWMNRPTPLGLPIWMQFSTGLKSTPKSKLEVHTTTLSCSSRKASSTQRRIFLSILPWCMAIFPAKLGSASSKRWNQISHCARVLVKMRVVLFFCTNFKTWGRRCKPKCPRQGKLSMLLGRMDLTFIFLLIFASTVV